MVLNITRPMTSASFPDIRTRREKLFEKGGIKESDVKFSGLPRGELLTEVKRLRRDVRKHEKEKNGYMEKCRRLDRLIGVENDVELWAKDFLIFEKPSGGAAVSLRAAFENKEVMSWHEEIHDLDVVGFDDVYQEAEIFRVEHDWFKAIKKADEFESGSFRLPYETSIFEFQVSRKAVVAMCINYGSDGAENEIVMQIATESFFGWSLSHNLYRHAGGRWEVVQSGQTIKEDKLEHLVELIGNQIRAACIALDADVATTTLVRETHSGDEPELKDFPEYEFYTIGLAPRSRAEALASHGELKGTKRLHFRRGHWRHFTASKTWVRWCLVGNPELGFIDKQYRL